MTRPRAAGTENCYAGDTYGMGTRKRWATVTTAVVTAIALSACRSAVSGTATVSTSEAATYRATTTTTTVPTTTTVEPLDALVKRALTDADAFWERELGRVISVEVKPFDSSVGDRPTCDGDAYEVAGFCPASSGDTIRFDISEMNRIRTEGGDLAVALVMAHEYGHAVLDDMGQPSRGVTAETRADCLSGAYMRTNAGDYTGDWNAAIAAAKPEGAEDADQYAARVAGIEAGRAMSDPAACLSYSP